MTSRTKMKAALRVAIDGAPRARANNFGAVNGEIIVRHCKKAYERALKTICRKSCGARRRRDGRPCNALNVPGRDRCKWHGGMSTGPKTPEGRARSLRNLRQYCQEAASEDG